VHTTKVKVLLAPKFRKLEDNAHCSVLEYQLRSWRGSVGVSWAQGAKNSARDFIAVKGERSLNSRMTKVWPPEDSDGGYAEQIRSSDF
jgi:hypothetical protein